MKKPTTKQSTRFTEAARITRRRERFLAKTSSHGYKSDSDLEDAIKYIQEKYAQEIAARQRLGALPEIPLPAAGKDDISEKTYGKQTRAAEMSNKVQDAIEKGEHPGAFIQREIIRPSGLKLEFIAEKIGVHAVTLSSLQNSRRSLSPELAAKLSSYFHTYSTLELLTIQAGHDAKKADQEILIGLPEEKNPTPA